MILSPFLGSIVIVNLFSILFFLTGIGLYQNSIIDGKDHPLSFRLGFGFFLGMAFFLSTWKLIDTMISQARLGLILTVILAIFISYISKSYKNLTSIVDYFVQHKSIFLFFGILIPLFLFVFWLKPVDLNGLSPYGSFHSMLYANKAIYYSQMNILTSESQNAGQSMLASIPLFVGLKSTVLLNLLLWIILCVLALCSTIFGVLRFFNFSFNKSLIGTFLIICGNTALSFLVVFVRDNGSPFFVMGYSHAIFSAGSFLGTAIWLRYVFVNRIKSWLWVILIIGVIIVAWIITAPECIVIGMPIFILLGIKNLKENPNFSKNMISLSLIVLFFLGLGLTQGGLLSPKVFRQDGVIPGLKGTSPVGSFIIIPNPGVGYFHAMGLIIEVPEPQSYKHVKYHVGEYRDKLLSLNLKEIAEVFLELWVRFEIEFWKAIKINFFPMLGIISLFFLLNKKPKPSKWIDDIGDQQLILLNHIYYFASVSFLIGFLIAFPFVYGSALYKWPLSRFFIPGHLLGMTCFFLVAQIFIEKLMPRSLNKKTIWILTIGIVTLGPVLHILIIFILNIIEIAPDGSNIFERAKKLVEVSEMWRGPW